MDLQYNKRTAGVGDCGDDRYTRTKGAGWSTTPHKAPGGWVMRYFADNCRQSKVTDERCCRW